MTADRLNVLVLGFIGSYPLALFNNLFTVYIIYRL